MEKDEVFKQDMPVAADFEFGKKVTAVFDGLVSQEDQTASPCMTLFSMADSDSPSSCGSSL